jgi:hypothetical protein
VHQSDSDTVVGTPGPRQKQTMLNLRSPDSNITGQLTPQENDTFVSNFKLMGNMLLTDMRSKFAVSFPSSTTFEIILKKYDEKSIMFEYKFIGVKAELLLKKTFQELSGEDVKSAFDSPIKQRPNFLFTILAPGPLAQGPQKISSILLCWTLAIIQYGMFFFSLSAV